MFVAINNRIQKVNNVRTQYLAYKRTGGKIEALAYIMMKKHSISRRTFWRWIKLEKGTFNYKYKMGDGINNVG
jgi:hypothetical protein